MTIMEKVTAIWPILFVVALIQSFADPPCRLDSLMYQFTKWCQRFCVVSVCLAVCLAIVVILVS